ncbi:unnamed protein product, partial [Trichogramma brassicae]
TLLPPSTISLPTLPATLYLTDFSSSPSNHRMSAPIAPYGCKHTVMQSKREREREREKQTERGNSSARTSQAHVSGFALCDYASYGNE